MGRTCHHVSVEASRFIRTILDPFGGRQLHFEHHAVPYPSPLRQIRLNLSAAVSFAAGFLALEGTGSFLHVFILRDVPGHTFGSLFIRDVLLAFLAGLLYAIGASFGPLSAHTGVSNRVFLLGIGYAAGLEALNWVMPGALLAPASVGQGLAAWGYFVGAAMLSARVSRTSPADNSPLH